MFNETFHRLASFLIQHGYSVQLIYSENTITGYAWDLKTFKDFLHKLNRPTNLDEITSSTIRRFIQDLELNKHAKPRSVHRKIFCLKFLSSFCLKENYIKIDFMAGIQFSKIDDKLPVYMILEELFIRERSTFIITSQSPNRKKSGFFRSI
ncbi:site-specific integrase [Saccharococcus caldoxylosilyticus]|uniref:site-specific integrase n=1 Tax=Saccharococcus caldoxylosilyticus TaxID=81408 RepID=UPI0004746793|nr:site-specific integrase [Parageobacillus caldoxylosilyticus]